MLAAHERLSDMFAFVHSLKLKAFQERLSKVNISTYHLAGLGNLMVSILLPSYLTMDAACRFAVCDHVQSNTKDIPYFHGSLLIFSCDALRFCGHPEQFRSYLIALVTDLTINNSENCFFSLFFLFTYIEKKLLTF